MVSFRLETGPTKHAFLLPWFYGRRPPEDATVEGADLLKKRCELKPGGRRAQQYLYLEACAPPRSGHDLRALKVRT